MNSDEYDSDFDAVKARIGPRYIRDREADLDAAYQDEGALTMRWPTRGSQT